MRERIEDKKRRLFCHYLKARRGGYLKQDIENPLTRCNTNKIEDRKRRIRANSNMQGMAVFLSKLNRTTVKDLRSTSRSFREKIPKEKVQIKIKRKLSNNNVVKMLSTAPELPINEKHGVYNLIGRLPMFKNITNEDQFNKKQWVVFIAILILSDGFNKNFRLMKLYADFLGNGPNLQKTINMTIKQSTNKEQIKELKQMSKYLKDKVSTSKVNVALKARLLKFTETLNRLRKKENVTLLNLKELFEILSINEIEEFYYVKLRGNASY
tara:strand:+ start:830 stop:1633 length:804 start_codon:yes stop_codon:yes gene_type:complete